MDVRCFISQFVSDSTGNRRTNTTGNPEGGGVALLSLFLLFTSLQLDPLGQTA